MVAEMFSGLEAGTVLADELSPWPGPTLLRAVVVSSAPSEEAPEAVPNAEVGLRGHVSEVMGNPTATDRHVAATDPATSWADRLPPGRRRRPVQLVERHHECPVAPRSHDRILARAER
jgi:hypothetical protein